MNENVRPSFAIVRTQLPYVDRRSLSEAWFSALHLVARDAREAPRPQHAVIAGGTHAVPTDPRATTGARPAGGTVASPRAGRYAATLAASGGAGDSPALEPANVRGVASVHRAAVRRQSYPSRRTSLTLAVDGSRVQLVLRREGHVLHVVALCRSDVAARVSDALARADAHLRRSGDTVRACVRAVDAGVRR